MEFTIDLAKKEDFKSLAALRWEFQREEEDAPPLVTREAFIVQYTSFLHQENEDDSWRHWTVKADQKIIGHASLKIIRSLPRPNSLVNEFGYLTNVYVQSPYRNHGIGESLLQAIKKWSKAVSLELLLVWPSERSFPFYKRSGFTDEGEPLSLHW